MTCARCGNFMCDECSVGGSETLCPKCIALSGRQVFPYDRNNVGFSELINYCVEVFKREWVMLCIAVLILMAVGMVSNIIGSTIQGILNVSGMKGLAATFIGSGVGTFLGAIIQGAFQLGIYRVNFDVLEGRKADLGRVFSQMSKVGRYVVQSLIVTVAFALPILIYFGVVYFIASRTGEVPLDPGDWANAPPNPVFLGGIGLGVLIFLPLAFYFGLPLQFASMELVYADCDAVEALRRAFQIANGFRLWIFGYAMLGSVAMFVGILACCVGIIAAIALVTLVNSAFYFAIRNGSGLPPVPQS